MKTISRYRKLNCFLD